MKIINFLIHEMRQLVNSIKKSYAEAPSPIQKGAKRALGSTLLVVFLFWAWNAGANYLEQKHLEEELAKGPQVKTAIAVTAPAARKVKLIGEAKPFASVTLYAKVSGYLKEVKVDKGDVVKKGQLLAVIQSPETDKNFQAAAADAKNKKLIAERIKKLLARDLVSQQEAETAQSDADVAAAKFGSEEVQKSNENLRAPFDGTVTSRFADPGALVQNATNSQTSALPVVALADVSRLRVYVYLDQRDALFIAKGTSVVVTLPEQPDLQITGVVERMAGQLDEKTRMLLAEIDLENKKGQIVPGSLVEVSLDLKTLPGIQIPAEAVVMKDGKTVVPLVDEKNEINYVEVKVTENDGKNVRLQSGIKEGKVVALNLGNTLADHAKVRPVPTPLPAAAATTTSVTTVPPVAAKPRGDKE